MTIFYSAAGVKPVFLGSDSASSGGATGHTFPSQPLGSGGLLALLVTVYGSGAPTAIGGVTVGGDAATQVVNITGAGNLGYAAGIFQISGKSGTGDVAVSVPGGSADRYHLYLVQLRGIKNTTAHDTDSYAVGFGGGTSGPLSLDVPKRGACLALAFGATSSTTITWSSNITPVSTISNVVNSSIAAGAYKTDQSPLALTATFSSISAVRLVAASWR